MAYSSTNIIVGAAAFYHSVKNSAEDSGFYTGGVPGVVLPSLGSARAEAALNGSSEWHHVGFTSEGVEFSYEPDFGEVQVDQLLDVAKMFKQGMRASVNTTLTEATLENLILAWGQKSSSLASGELKIEAGSLGDEPVERSLAFVGPAPRGSGGAKQERVYWLRRALQVEASNHSLSRNDATVIPCSFRLLAHQSVESGGDYGTIKDRTFT